jgi:hypothetical protein
MSSFATELAYRKNGGVEVVLLWNAEADVLVVSVTDVASGDGFAFDVDSEAALDAFYHPYAYAALVGIPFGAGGDELAHLTQAEW